MVHNPRAARIANFDLKAAGGGGTVLGFQLTKLKGQLACADLAVTLQKYIIRRRFGMRHRRRHEGSIQAGLQRFQDCPDPCHHDPVHITNGRASNWHTKRGRYFSGFTFISNN